MARFDPTFTSYVGELPSFPSFPYFSFGSSAEESGTCPENKNWRSMTFTIVRQFGANFKIMLLVVYQDYL